MPISSLPDSTLRAITSTLVLNDAVSLVKELIDNALDAKATTIAIEVSANTLDVIQVKDNGTGIGVEDRQLVCKRGCTSKITTIEDLERLGGSSLGFRGEALASVADLSESVTLTTRVDGEMAASNLKYGPAGALMSCSSASHPVGSTIRVKDFLKSIPVRKQTALKNASKALTAIKKLLHAYAFARGTVRFSLKVLKGKNEKANWSYTPVDNAEKLRDVAARIVGNDVVGRCETKRSKNEHGEVDIEDQYSAVALLATIGSDAVKLHNAGQYISVDGRPMTATRGTIKEVVKLYRQYTRGTTDPVQELSASFDPLLVLNLRCPRGSYDVNVEPAKDEVMFIHPEAVLTLAESLFKDYYGEYSPPNTVLATTPMSNVASEANPSTFSLLLAKKPAPSTEPTDRQQGPIPCVYPLPRRSDAPVSHQHAQGESETLSSVDNDTKNPSEPSEDGTNMKAVTPRARSNMYGFDEDETHMLLSDTDDGEHERGDAGVVARNPWSLAKLNAPIGRPSKTDEFSPTTNEHSTSSISPQSGDPQLHSTPQANTHRQPLGLRPQLLSPATSPPSQHAFQNPGPPKRPWPSRQPREDSPELESRPAIPATPSTQGRRGAAKLLDSWVKPTIARTELPSFKRVSEIYDKDGRFENSQDSGPIESSGLQNSSSTIDHAHSHKTSPLGHPFKSPLLNPPAGAAPQRRDHSSTTPRVAATGQQTLFKLSQSQNPQLQQIMEFEHRKKAANAQQRKAFGKARGRDMSVAKLAQLQQSTMQTPDDDFGSAMMTGCEADMTRLNDQASTVTAFSDRFGEKPTAGLDITKRPNPHQNRYLAAARGLTRDRPDPPESEADKSSTAIRATVVEDADEIPTIPEDDTRAYLIRHRTQTANADSGGFSRTGLKIRRTKTIRLPLETVPPDMMLHELVLQVNCKVQNLAEASPTDDSYISTGKNDFVSWSSAMTDVSKWQNELSTLIENLYRARVEGELISPDLGLDLRKMIKIHCDNI